jgi:alpha-N-arabinofuranosidase
MDQKKQTSPGYAAFEYFEYQGNDPVYDSIEAGTNEYLNPILSGFYPDPSIVRVGDDFYLVNSTFSFFPGIPIFHSRDLVNWTQIGHVLDRPSQLKLDSLNISHGVFAPAISYHDGLFYVVNTIVYGIGNFVVTAKDPAGPWSDPVVVPFEGIDPSLFFDNDGRAYMVNNGSPDYEPLYEGHRAIWIQEFDKEKMEMVGTRKVIVDGGVDLSKKPIWIEGPHIFRVGEYYYLSAAEGGTSVDHSQVIFRSKNVWGPYIPWEKNPILTQRHLDPARANPVTSTGHMDMVEIENGEWWAVFLGCTPYEDNYYNTGRQTFMLPVQWTDGWPVVLTGNEEVPYKHTRPGLEAREKAPVPLNGNFTFRDEFNDSTLSMIYSMIRTPYEKWYSLEAGRLLMKARNESIDRKSQPSFIGRRQQHHFCEAVTAMDFNPVYTGDKAGMTVFQNEKNYYLLALTKKEDGTYITLEKGTQEGPVEIAKQRVKNSNEPFKMKIVARGEFYDFHFSASGTDWVELASDIDARLLSTQDAGGFVGSYFGLYAYAGK